MKKIVLLISFLMALFLLNVSSAQENKPDEKKVDNKKSAVKNPQTMTLDGQEMEIKEKYIVPQESIERVRRLDPEISKDEVNAWYETKKTSKNEKPKPQEKCAVCDKPINKEIWAFYKGKKIYFCGEKCREKFYIDPDPFYQTLYGMGIKFEILQYTPKRQDICPITGKKVDGEFFVIYHSFRPDDKRYKIYAYDMSAFEKINRMTLAQYEDILTNLKNLGFMLDEYDDSKKDD